mmetsp:Transcript_45695/g.138855  ORF Transcript_45695/g.138855 Transcript_45695/m.138855 type:complete len:83 (-) Transcript_45695:580-828(-)
MEDVAEIVGDVTSVSDDVTFQDRYLSPCEAFVMRVLCPSITGNESVLPILCPSTPFYMAQTVNSPVSRASILMVAAVPIGEF